MRPLHVTIEDLETHATQRSAFIKSPVRIGRSDLNDLPLPLPFVSSWHGVVQFDDDEVRYVDLGSTNGSLLDGARLERNVPSVVREESELVIGTLRLQFSRSGVAAAPPPRPATSFDLRVSSIAPLRAATPPPAALAPEDAALAERALSDAALELDLLHASYRASWEHLRSALEQSLLGVTGAARTAFLARIGEKYEGVRAEPQFRALAGEPPEEKRETARAGASTGLLAAFAQSYVPRPDDAASPEGAQHLLSRTAEVLEAFATAYLELRKGREEFGREMGLTIHPETQVQRARSVKDLLTYLLDLRANGRTSELQRAFAELMLHQVALLNGVLEGARGLLGQLDPQEIAHGAGQGVWPLRAGTQWKAYEARWHELADEQETLSHALFGPMFARAYRSVVGQKDEDEQPPKAAPGRR